MWRAQERDGIKRTERYKNIAMKSTVMQDAGGQTSEEDHEEPSEEREHCEDVDGQRRAHGESGRHAAVSAAARETKGGRAACVGAGCGVWQCRPQDALNGCKSEGVNEKA